MSQVMTLGDLRKLAIRKQVKIRFPLRNGMECVIGDDGVARIPDLKAQPDFKLEDEFAEAAIFTLEPLTPVGQKTPPKTKPVTLGRAEMTAMASQSPSAVAVHDDHDDE
ncbi:MAG: hypothetical protein JWP63_6860 [Candidatus Solibacter sp.]|jgi:hypothetical protein|nr:hypothetical protein [Candidatus Solibacter sp.]